MSKQRRRIEHPEVVRRFAARLREFRVSRGMTQAQLAEAASLTTTYITRLENAGAAPGIDTADRLAAALGCGVTDLLTAVAPVPDAQAVAQAQVRRLAETLVGSADLDTLLLAAQLLARLVGTAR
jgi:transcriptional regulator with XRE-family HTH domain